MTTTLRLALAGAIVFAAGIAVGGSHLLDRAIVRSAEAQPNASQAPLTSEEQTVILPLGLFGASTGGAAALVLAAEQPDRVKAVVSRGGRPDLAGRNALLRVQAATLLIVGGDDVPVVDLNRSAFANLGTRDRRLEIVPGASHLFEESGALETVACLATEWFAQRLRPPGVGGGSR